MKYVFLTMICAFSLLMVSTQHAINDPDAEKRNVGSFHTIHADNGIDLYLVQGVDEAVAVSAASRAYCNRIVSKVENGIQIIFRSKWSTVLE